MGQCANDKSAHLQQHLFVPHLHKVKDVLEGALVVLEVLLGLFQQLLHRVVVVPPQGLERAHQPTLPSKRD